MKLFVFLPVLSAMCFGAEALRTSLPAIPSYNVKRATSPIVVDGKLDDAAWKSAATLNFQFPWKNQTGAMQKTVARLLWDDEYLYVSYDCEDTDITAHFDKRDDPTYRDDAVEFFINPRPADSGYVGMEMNAKGILYDYLYIFPKFFIKRFDLQGVHLRTNLRGTLNNSGDRDHGWSLEVAIPWSNFDDFTKTPPQPGTIWTANLNRWDGTEPNRRLSQWSDSGLVTPSPHNPDRFGKLIFVK
jgi:hypothetical protein